MEYTHRNKKVMHVSAYEFGKEMCWIQDMQNWLVICRKEGKGSTIMMSGQRMDNVHRYRVS